MLDTVRSEAVKLRTVPSVLVACLATAVLTIGLAYLSGWSVGNALDTDPTRIVGNFTPESSGFDAIAYGQAGMVVLGVLAVSGEYAGGQIRTSLIAVPDRRRLLAAKAAAVTVAALVVSAVTVPGAFAVTQIGLGDHGYPWADVPDGPVPGALVGAVVYWVVLALLSAGLTVVVRNAVVPLVVLISLVLAGSFFLTMLTDMADLLPDRAGAQMYDLRGGHAYDLTAVEGGAVMLAWTAAVWLAAAVLFTRRDA
ncbi:ABC transporter permease [Nocardiopsis sp. NPDC050513]|uniref:ABC transporter permease n=1 Tax=Nocardiopsis sp. NPDC050513 TaxID=3364338 RepID=UPI0037BCC699